MNLTAAAVRNRTFTVFSTMVLIVAGLAAFGTLGQLEDPEFTIKSAIVVTPYPGAAPSEVELEVTDRIEQAIQKMPQIKQIESLSRFGLSHIKVDIQPKYRSDVLPQIWDELRRKVNDVRTQLPPGAGTPQVIDDFGNVYGFVLGVVGDGFNYAEVERHVDAIKKELSLVKGVARVELWGVQPEAVYLDVNQTRLVGSGLTVQDIRATLQQQNLVVDAGAVEVDAERLRVEATGMFRTPEDIGDLTVRSLNVQSDQSQALIRIRDVATVRRGYVEPSTALMRVDGRPALGMSIANQPGVNIVNLGLALDARLRELIADLPVGIEVQRVAWQGDLVSQSIKDFVVNLVEAVVIVLVVLWVAMGLRPALIVGFSGLIFVILGTFVVMALFKIDLQRMSLGALIIAMGMMVDNAIVVVDNMMVRIGSGMDREKAAIESASAPSMPLLGATVIAVLAFFPIALSTENAGEYCASLFSMVAISLLLSWVMAITITPVMGMAMLAAPKADAAGGDPYAGGMFAAFRGVLRAALKLRMIVIILGIGLLVTSLWGFQFVGKMFFPNSSRPQFMVDIWLPEGTRIENSHDVITQVEKQLQSMPEVQSVAGFVGQGPPRFYLPVEPEKPYSSYGQLIVTVHDFRTIETLMVQLSDWSSQHMAEALVFPRKYGLGPSETWPVKLRVSGPAVADPDVLRRLAREAADVIASSPYAKVVRTDWRERTKKVVAQYDQTNGRWTMVSRAGVADATRRAFDGAAVGQYREQDKLLPIYIRHVEEERRRAPEDLQTLLVNRDFGEGSVPLAQVTRDIAVQWEDPLIWRLDRRRAVMVQALPVGLATELRSPDIVERVAQIKLPPGYTMTWEGEYRNSRDSQASLVPGIVPALLLVALTLVALFNSYRQPLAIALIIPLALIGVVGGLILTGQPFGFVALLGAMSLAGMMIKNAIVLIDEINARNAAGDKPYDAVITAAVSRLRPVLLAAGTTVLGVLPLLQDVFWVSMAVTIMFGLALGTVITMVFLPALYCVLYRVTPNTPAATAKPEKKP
jgi:multidrug efflux pump subunit AcrB